MLSRRRAVLAAVSFSKLTAYDLVVSSWELGVTVRSEILPLIGALVCACEGEGWVSDDLPEAEEVPDLLLGDLSERESGRSLKVDVVGERKGGESS